MANTYLTRTPATPTLSTKFTFSAWIKRSFIGNADNTLIAKLSLLKLFFGLIIFIFFELFMI